MTVVRKYDSHQGGVKCIRNVCKLMERCDVHVGGVKWRGVTPLSMLRVYLTVTGEIQQTIKIQEIWIYSKEIQGVGSILDFLENSWICKVCLIFWPLEYSRIYMKFKADS